MHAHDGVTGSASNCTQIENRGRRAGKACSHFHASLRATPSWLTDRTHLRDGDLASSSGASLSFLFMLWIIDSYWAYLRSTSFTWTSEGQGKKENDHEPGEEEEENTWRASSVVSAVLQQQLARSQASTAQEHGTLASL